MKRIEIGKNIVTMRPWDKSLQPVRAMLLSAYAVDLFEEPEKYKEFLEVKRKDLDGKSLLDLIHLGEWEVIADFLDDALTGSPS